MPVERGFTLLEILAALAIAAVGIAAVAKATGGAASVLQVTENRLLGSWVASNRIAELRLSRRWPATKSSDRTDVMGGRTWYYRESLSTTADPDILRVDIRVYTDPDHNDQSASLFGYVARSTPPAVNSR